MRDTWLSRTFFACFFAVFLTSPVLLAGVTNNLSSLQSGTWYQYPNSTLDGSGQEPIPMPAAGFANDGYGGIMSDWSGAAYDTTRDKLIVTGGGHAGYAGNEIYTFDVSTGVWARIWGPTPNGGLNCVPAAGDWGAGPSSGIAASGTGIPTGSYEYQYYCDNNPAQRHNRGSLVYLPTQDALFECSGSEWMTSDASPPTGLSDFWTWWFNFSGAVANTWSHNGTLSGSGRAAAYDPVTGHVFMRAYPTIYSYSEYIYEYTPTTQTWSSAVASNPGGWEDTAAIDPVHRIMLSIGNGVVTTFNLTTHAYNVSPTITGNTAIIKAVNPGLVYDSNLGVFVAYVGGGETSDQGPSLGIPSTSVTIIDPVSLNFTQIPALASNTVTPDQSNGNGTWGRFNYSPNLEAFVVVNQTSSSVYGYKLAALTDTTPPVVTAFTTGAVTGNGPYSIAITALTATDNDRVAGYQITTTPVPPTASWNGSWSFTAPTSYSVSTPGVYDLYAWAMDMHGNVSAYAISSDVMVSTTIKRVPEDIPTVAAAMTWANSNGPGSVVQIDASHNPFTGCMAGYPSGCKTTTTAGLIGTVTGSGITVMGINGVAQIEWQSGDPTSSSLTQTIPQANGAIVAVGSTVNNLRLENLEIFGAGYINQGVGILTYQGASGTLYIKNCSVHNNEGGNFLGAIMNNGLNIVIVGSQFYNSGFNYAGDTPGGQYHNIYIGEANSLVFYDSASYNSFQGILLKSRADSNYIAYSYLVDQANLGLCSTNTTCSDKNIDLPYGHQSYIIGNVLQKSLKDDGDGTFISFNAEQRFTLYFTNGTGTELPNSCCTVVTNTRTGHQWKVGSRYSSASGYWFSDNWSGGVAAGAIYQWGNVSGNLGCATSPTVLSCDGVTTIEFQQGDTLTYTGGQITVTAPSTPVVGYHNQWSYGTGSSNNNTLNGFYAINNTFVNYYTYAEGSAYATYTYNDTKYAQSQNNLFVGLQGGSFPFTINPKDALATTETNDKWLTSDPGFTSASTFNFTLTSGALSAIGASSAVTPKNGFQLYPIFEYSGPGSLNPRSLPGCQGAYAYSNTCGTKPQPPPQLKVVS